MQPHDPSTQAPLSTAGAPWRAALVTGASRGLGRALAEALAAAGVPVVLVARGEAARAHAGAALRARGGEAHAIVADIADKRAIHAIAGQAAGLVGPVDLLINNASALGPTPLRPLLDTECEALEEVLQTNLVGPFRLTRAIAGSMALRGRGLVINISSDAAIEAYPSWGAYSASKAALDHLTRIWAAELADRGVRLLSIDPGEMDTAMHAAAIPDADRGALARPEAVAAAILGLMSDPARAPSGGRLDPAAFAREEVAA
ncbi:MAG: SDR family oxidoreductase [Myxococcales bacterium]|nr:SDR family oxidoreductase [Myxococcales bacterium]